MYFSAETLDDVLHDVLSELVKLPFNVIPTRGKTSEIVGALIHIKNSRARLSRTETRGKLFSSIGELLWYLSGENSLNFITHYISKYEDESEDGKTVYGGYGPRLFNLRNKYNQIANVIKLLKEKPFSRKAVIQIFDGADINDKHSEIPCTCVLQFFVRNNKLHMVVYVRSNDAYIGLPHDVFAFTMLQEIIARTLSIELGEYKQSIGSLHLYEHDKKLAIQYIDEGFQSTIDNITMPPMPKKDPWDSIDLLLKMELQIRQNKNVEFRSLKIDSYWADLLRLLVIHSLFKHENYTEIKKIQSEMHSRIFDMFIEKRLENSEKKIKNHKEP